MFIIIIIIIIIVIIIIIIIVIVGIDRHLTADAWRSVDEAAGVLATSAQVRGCAYIRNLALEHVRYWDNYLISCCVYAAILN